MIYVVTGYMRSGTSMMMQALQAGGLEAFYRPERDEMNTRFGDEHYQPNPGGFFEIYSSDVEDPEFVAKCDGKVVKVLHSAIPHLPAADYRVVLMRRDPEEIRQSYRAALMEPADMAFLETYSERMDALQAHMTSRGMDVVALDFSDVIERPLYAFYQLISRGWPITLTAAAPVVNPALYRFRLPLLEVGI